MTTEHFTQPSIGARLWKGSRPFRPVFVVLVVVFVVLAIAQPVFASAQNLQNLLTSISVLWIVAMGMTLVLITAGADLSVAPIGALAGILLAKLLQAGVPVWLAIIISLLGGAALGGFVNGTLIGRFNVSFFVVTLGTLTAFTGIVNLWSNTESIPVTEPAIINLAVTRFLGLSGPVWIMIIIFVVTLFIQQRTFFGRDVYAVGGSISAARLSGIRVPRTIIMVYAFSGLCAAIAGIVAISRIGVASPQVDANLPLQAIAAVLLGGTALSGGTGGVVGTAFGVLFIGVLSNGLSIAGVPSFWQQIVTGVILVVAVLADRIGLRRRTKATAETGSTPPPESTPVHPETAAKTSH
ncbi:ABC transporter permease [Subtercola sp. YIM 133946]|uniref:ABC transporter permease n=1 Tax=Subtercola sp. YIM 133946 TaxID=3118909 RepID=UPI002F93175B